MDNILLFSDPEYHQKNIGNLKNNLIFHNYPGSFIDKHIKNAAYGRVAQLASSDLNRNTKKNFEKTLALQNIGKFTDKVKYTLKKASNQHSFQIS